MRYLILIFITCFFIAAIIWIGIKLAMLRRQVWQKIISRDIVKGSFFSTPVLQQLVYFIFRCRSAYRARLLKEAQTGKYKKLISEITDPMLCDKLRLMIYGKANPDSKHDALYYLLQGEIFWRQCLYDKAFEMLNKIKDVRLSPSLHALRSLLTARIALYEGDLQTASLAAAQSLKIFRRKNWLFEEASVYFLQGIIYRISGVFDTSEIMLRSALKLYQSIFAAKYEAETMNELASLLSLQGRFAEADDYLTQAAKIFIAIGDKENYYFVISHQAMTALQRGDLEQTFRLARQAAEGHRRKAGRALAEEILARACFADKKWKNAAQTAAAAAEKYFHNQNFSAGFESLYLSAEALFQLQDFTSAEPILRKIIRKETKHRCCFHVANAYTLLGLILLQKGQTKRARTLFNQALKYEFSNDRNIGIAVDYANLAVAEKKCGNLEAFYKNLEAALAYAQTVDDDLYNRLKNYLD